MDFWIENIRDLLGVTLLMVEHDMRLVSAVSDRIMALDTWVRPTERLVF